MIIYAQSDENTLWQIGLIQVPNLCVPISYQNCCRIVSGKQQLYTFANVFVLHMLVENCLPALSYIICGYTADYSFIPIISSNASLFFMTFCYSRKLPSNVPSARGKPTKIHFLKHQNKKLFCMQCDVVCEDSTELPGISYFTDFIGTTRFCRRTKLISRWTLKVIFTASY